MEHDAITLMIDDGEVVDYEESKAGRIIDDWCTPAWMRPIIAYRYPTVRQSPSGSTPLMKILRMVPIWT